MHKALRTLLILILGLVMSVLVIGVVFILFVDANHFKPFIVNEVQKATGRTLVLHGDLGWSLFPSLGLKVKEVSLGNPPGFVSDQVFASVQEAKISIKVLPLIQGRVEAEELMINGLTLNLIKDHNGRTNWEPLLLQPSNAEPTPAGKADHAVSVTIPDLTIQNATMTWKDLSSNQSAQLTQIDFKADQIQFYHAFPVKGSLMIHSQDPSIEGRILLTGNITFNPQMAYYALNSLRMEAALQPGSPSAQKLHVVLMGDVVAKNHTLSTSNLELQLNEDRILITLDLQDMNKWIGSFSLLSQSLDLDPWLPSGSETKTKISSTSEIQQQNTLSLNELFKQAHLTGQIAVNHLKIAGLSLESFKTPIVIENSNIVISPVTGNFYAGNLQSKLSILFQKPEPFVSISGSFNQIAMKPFLKDLLDYDNIEGTGDLSFSIAGQASHFLRTATGQVFLSVRQGALKGLNIPYLIAIGQAIINKQTLPASQGLNQTDFGHLTGTATITQGIMTSRDFHLLSPSLEASGEGTINLVNQKIDFEIQASPLGAKNIVIPIAIQGPFSDVSVGVNKTKLLTQMLKQQLEKHTEQLKEKIQKTFQNIQLDQLFH